MRTIEPIVAISGEPFVDRICEILGLDASKVCSAQIGMAAGHPVTVTVETIVSEEEANAALTELRRYALVTLDEETEPERS